MSEARLYLFHLWLKIVIRHLQTLKDSMCLLRQAMPYPKRSKKLKGNFDSALGRVHIF